ncbi:MAG: ferric reductase-like transmembrane domain-containing protein [Corynebacterium variabile]|uniref:ferric reductase-like transmembrane domain-containing protein n=1 Tax=Corynebacterium variabile TaxID=1727 RepID=UPI00289DEFA9|nr:ferric reductase-like transmembrane domain-containing protein [Corynebacterium variabile]
MDTDTVMWVVARGFGLTALVLMTVALVAGIVARSGRPVAGMERFAWQDVHRNAALTAVALVGVHVVTLIADPVAQVRLLDVVVPWAGRYRPLWQGFGTLAVDLLAVVVVTALARRWTGPRVFHLVHLSTYLLWPVCVVHGLGTGTDAFRPWSLAVTVSCCAVVLAAVVWRTGTRFEETGTLRRRALSGERREHEHAQSR